MRVMQISNNISSIINSNNRKFIFLLLLAIVMIPSVLYFYGYKKHLNIDNGNILTVYYLGGLKLYEKEEKTELSPYMKNHIFDGDNHYLPILQKKGFAKQDFRNHHCYYELKMYFMECDLEQKEISVEKINEIIDNYLKTKI